MPQFLPGLNCPTALLIILRLRCDRRDARYWFFFAHGTLTVTLNGPDCVGGSSKNPDASRTFILNI